jgi:RNA polymerase sigma-70 factor (ECF subfamily)
VDIQVGIRTRFIMTLNEIVLLIERARDGDRQAFGELVLRFQPAVYAVALARQRDVNEAVELTQEVFIHAMTKLEQLRDPLCFVGWLRQITVRMAINRVTRKAAPRGTEPEILQSAPDRGSGPLELIIRAENRSAVWRGLDRLKEQDRATLVAFYIHGRSLKQMARESDAPIGTIKRRLHVARNRLRKQLERAEARRNRRKPRLELAGV